MKKILALLILVVSIMACKKSVEPECVTWSVLYWQGTSNKTTVTSNYTPYNRDEQICGAGKDTVSREKTVVIRQVNSNLFDYKTFQAKR